MEDVLRLYARPWSKTAPVVCFDERPVVLHDDARAGLPMKPGRVGQRDYEYVRKGTANIFCVVEPKSGKRLSYATPSRTGPEFAKAMAKLARAYPCAKKIHVVMDNLNTHFRKSVVSHYGEKRGGLIWKRFVVHYTPKHASWLNMAEMEASLVSRECLGSRRLGSFDQLAAEVEAWRRAAVASGRTIEWKFRVHDARRVFRYDGILTTPTGH